jgi:phage repressor protein C with HTH and peptisase S24 domain
VSTRSSRPADLQHLVAARLSALRRQQELTQDEAARRLGIALRNYQRMESGRQNLTLQTIEKVARALGVSALDVVAIPAVRPPAGLHIIPSAGDDIPDAVPVFDLDAAAGYARTGRAAGALGWTLLPDLARHDRPFVAQVTGASMEPLIPSGSWCLFSVAGAVDEGQVGLFELGGRGRPDDGGSYVVKRLRRDHDRAALHSVNRTYAPIPVDDDDVRCVARFVGVVAAP